MWSVTSVDQVLVGEGWWPSSHRTEGERDPFPWSDGPAVGGGRAGLDRVTVPRPMLRAIARGLPAGRARRLRTRLIRSAGFPAIAPSAIFLDLPTINRVEATAACLAIGPGSFVNAGCSFDLGATITLGDHVYLGDRVRLITSTADADIGVGPGRTRRREDHPNAVAISIGSGAWLGAGSVVGPGVQIGARAIVAAGTMVTEDVPANTMVAGAPAAVVRQLAP
jgi:acetyltransferase-like isoleucine patch superfamily enzyme